MQQIHQDDAPVGPSLGLTNPSFSAETLSTSSKLTADSFLFMQIIREILKSCGLGYTSEKWSLMLCTVLKSIPQHESIIMQDILILAFLIRFKTV